MAEAAANVENFSTVRKEDLENIYRRFSCSPDGMKNYYITKKGVWMNIRDVNIHCLENYQIDIEIAGGQNSRLWQILEDEINRRKQEAGR